MEQKKLNSRLLGAAGRGDTKSVEDCLARGADVNFKNEDGLSSLHWVSRYGLTETVSRLVDRGADINAKDVRLGRSVLHFALQYDKTETVSRLLDLGADVNAKDNLGRCVLQLALQGSKTELVSRLLDLGADVNVKDNLQQSVLHFALQYGKTETVFRLLDMGADVNAKDNSGESVLHFALRYRKAETVTRLVDLGADVNTKNYEGRTPYDMAHDADIKELLKAAQDNVNKGLPTELFQMDKESASVFTDLLKEDSYELFELRFMLQGEQGTGKSTIARFLVGMGPTKFRMSTDGIELYTGLSFFDDETNDWIGGKQGFGMEDITVSRSIKAFKKEGSSLQELTEDKKLKIAEKGNTEYEQPDNISEEYCENQSPVLISTDKQAKQGHASESTDNIRLKDNELKNRLTGEYSAKLENLNNLEKKTLINPNYHVPFEPIKNLGLIEKLKAFFGIKQEVEQIQISVTKTEFFNKSRDVAKKKFHKRKIVPVTIWDFGGQDVFYSTHQTFLTYRAVYMLVLDGSRTLNEPCKYEQFLPGRDGAKTQRDYIRFWINTIITYCKGEITGFPKIMVILTHKDKLKGTEIERRRNEIFGEIEEMFDGSLIKQHLAIEDRIFVNARDSSDSEMEKIKTSLMHQARIQPTWGQKMPKCFLPLELEIQCLAKKGYTLIHIEHMKEINSQQPIRPLSNSELTVFLKFQHSVGKILYFDEPYLDQNIIISPTFLIDAFKSIITDQQFCKGDKQKEEAWYSMGKNGIIFKQAVETIWKQRKYANFFKSMWYLLRVMTHLDILVEPRRYDLHHQRIPTEFFYVACMVRKQDTTGYLQSPTFCQRNIALSFDATSSIIPPALSFRFISYCLSIWGVKRYGDHNEDMLFHVSAVFTIDPSLDLHIKCEEERLIVRLVHARSRTLIMKDLASSIRECLFAALHKISQLYITTSSENERNTRSFDVKICCSTSIEPCVIDFRDMGDVWICSRHQIEHEKDTVLSWFTEKGKESCESSCPVTDKNFLQQSPTDLHLRRLATKYNRNEVRQLVIALGLPYEMWDKLNTSALTDETIGFTALEKCFKMVSFTFNDLKIVAEKEHIQNPHTICKVLRDRHIRFDTEPEKWDLIATDEDIDKLAPLVGSSSLGFLVELGLTFQDWEQIEYSQTERDLVKLNRKIMEAWRDNCRKYNIKPSLRTIGQAFGNIGINIKNIENLLFN